MIQKVTIGALLRRTIAAIGLAALALPLATAGEWENEGKKLADDCAFKDLSFLKSCPTFFFHDGKPVRMSIPASVVPGGGTAVGAIYIQPLDIHNWAESNLTVEGGSSIR